MQIQMWTCAHFSQNLFVPEGLTVVQQSAFPSMHRGLVTERQPGPHVTRQNNAHTHRLLSRQKFICCIQMPVSNYTFTCSERVSEHERGGREGKERLLWGIWHCCYSEANILPWSILKKDQIDHVFFLYLLILILFSLSVTCYFILGSARLNVKVCVFF